MRGMSQTGIGLAEFDPRKSAIHPRSSAATEGRGLDAEPSELAQRATRGERTGERGSAAPVNPEALARGGFQVLQRVLRVVASGLIWPRFLGKTPGPFACDCVWLRLAAGVCAQECAQGYDFRSVSPKALERAVAYVTGQDSRHPDAVIHEGG